MNIQEMLGEAFHEGITIEEINTALSGKKFADLSTGNYVDKNKYNADLQAKDAELTKTKTELTARLTDDEKAAANIKAQEDYIKQLETQIKNQSISSNRDRAEALTSDVKSILGIDGADESYSALLDIVANGDADVTRSTASYINKIVKDSYEKGKKDATKDNLGNFSNGVEKGESGKTPAIGDFGKQLAAGSKPTVDPNLYFTRK